MMKQFVLPLLLVSNIATAQFSKQVITREFITEGVAVGDVNKDGRKDIIAGAYWFAAPDWKRHSLAKADTFSVSNGYSNSFLNFGMDVNQDGWTDLVRIDFPGKAAVWHENPRNKSGHWKTHPVYKSVGNESPLMTDVDGDGRLDLLCNDPQEKKVIWLRSPDKGDTLWQRFVIAEGNARGAEMFTHGLGFGDVNGDGHKDVLIREGWWENPGNPRQGNWTFHPADLGADCSQMYVLDVNKDGLPDVISASAHNYGIWWHEQVSDGSWKHHEIHRSFSQTHGVALADINGDGYPDIITGKRYFAHNGGDPGAFEPAVLYWFEFKPGSTPAWIPHQVDNDSGVGLHLVVEDMNGDGKPDIVVGNKKGVHLFLQKK